jgi:hypothetical protein
VFHFVSFFLPSLLGSFYPSIHHLSSSHTFTSPSKHASSPHSLPMVDSLPLFRETSILFYIIRWKYLNMIFTMTAHLIPELILFGEVIIRSEVPTRQDILHCTFPGRALKEKVT